MKPEEIHLNDWQRILFGEVPSAFFIEVIFRVFITYVILMVSMRLMGKRMAAQLTDVEIVAMVSLAAAIGVPIQAPDRGVLPAIIIAALVVWIERFIASKTAKNEKLESGIFGDINSLVDDSVLNIGNMVKNRITQERVFAQLRSYGITNLGQVTRLYLETNGSFSMVKATEPQPGLSIIPVFDTAFISEQKISKTVNVCENCGIRKGDNPSESEECKNCDNNKWVPAIEN
jgi:uncharacterized membrane protein YcaP (DUF421 family)